MSKTKKNRLNLVLNPEEREAVRAAQSRSPFPLTKAQIVHTFIQAGIRQMNAKQPEAAAKK